MTMPGRSLADRLRAATSQQLTELGHIFAERPPTLDEFVTGSQYLDNPPLSEEQYTAVRHAEQVLFPETYKLMAAEWDPYWKPVREVNFIYLEWGKGSGKDHICRIIVARIVNILLCLRSPQEYFNMPKQDTIHILNVASSASQAHRAFFKPLVEMVKSSPWFQDKLLSEPGEQATSINFRKRIEAISGHSGVGTQEGLNLIAGIADEISEFRSKDEMERFARGQREPSRSAEAVIKMIRSSARTRFRKNFKLCAISYPRFINDPIQTLRKTAEASIKKYGSNSKYYASGPYASWEINPRLMGDEFVEHPFIKDKFIPESFFDDYEEDPIDSAAKYECDPPKSSGDIFFKQEDAVRAAFSREDEKEITLDYWYGVSKEEATQAAKEGRNPVEGWQVTFNIPDSFRPVAGALYCMHGDIGIRTDAAGIAMAHVADYREVVHTGLTEDGTEVPIVEFRPLVKVDFVFAFEGDKRAQPPRDVQIRWYRELCWELMKRGFIIRRYTFDGFQSTDTMQILESRGIESERVSTDMNNDVWNALKDVIYDQRLDAPANIKVITEILQLARKPNGKIDHPATGSKDMADAVGGAVFGAVKVGGRESEAGETVYAGDTADDFTVGAPVDMPVGFDDFTLIDIAGDFKW